MNPTSAKKVVVKMTMMKMRTKKKMEKENMYLRKNPPRERIPVIRNEFCTTISIQLVSLTRKVKANSLTRTVFAVPGWFFAESCR